MMDAGDHLLDLPPRPPVGVPVVCGALAGRAPLAGHQDADMGEFL